MQVLYIIDLMRFQSFSLMIGLYLYSVSSVYFLDVCLTRRLVIKINIEIKRLIIPEIKKTKPKRLKIKSIMGIL
jgi:hypothetical protein